MEGVYHVVVVMGAVSCAVPSVQLTQTGHSDHCLFNIIESLTEA